MNQAWDLKSFIEAITAELDRTRDLLRVKSVNRPLTYTVQDLLLNLNVFAEYDSDRVRFRTAQPNETGASKLEFKLGSITDRVVVETTKAPPAEGDPYIDEAPFDSETRSSLKKIGVESKRDLDNLGRRKVRIRTDEGKEVDFARLAAMLDQASRPRRTPKINHVVPVRSPAGTRLRLLGDALDELTPEASFNGLAVEASVADGVAEVEVPDASPMGDLVLTTRSGDRVRVQLVG